MSTEENKAIIRRFYEEILNNGNLSLLEKLMAPDFVYHGPGGYEVRGTESFKQMQTMRCAAFPDSHMTLEDMVAEGDKVTYRYTFRGTHKGDSIGIPPTEKQITVTGICISRFADGRQVETWEEWDLLSMYQQLDITPPAVPGEV